MNDLFNIKSKEVMRAGICYNHQFCAYCGIELTKLNLQKGFMSQSKHLLITLDNGIQVRKCYHGGHCTRRREKKKK